MRLDLALPVVSAVVSTLFTLLTLLAAAAPGWKQLRWFALIAGTAAVYACTDILPPATHDPLLIAWGSRICLAVAGLHGFAWIRYLAASASRPNTRLERVVGYTALGAGVASLVPDLVVAPGVRVHAVPWLGMTLADAVPTGLGVLVFFIAVGALLVPLIHYVREWKAGVQYAAPQAVGLAFLVGTAINDTLVGMGVYDGIYLVDAGFLVLVVSVGSIGARRFVQDARELDALSRQLEHLVEERTRELAAVQTASMRNEKLAAIGRLAAGVAHEVNNPAAAVLANLEYLQSFLERGEMPADARDCVEESLAAIARIARIVRQLLDAGRVAEGAQTVTPVRVADAVAVALSSSRSGRDEAIQIDVTVPVDLHVRGNAALLEQVLVNLFTNAAQAVTEARTKLGPEAAGRRGFIAIRAERDGDRVVMRVRDDGTGIGEEVRQRLFEPFFSTRPRHVGTGLGLAVSLGLVHTLGGELEVETTSAEGTTMRLDFPWSPSTPTSPAEAP